MIFGALIFYNLELYFITISHFFVTFIYLSGEINRTPTTNGRNQHSKRERGNKNVFLSGRLLLL